MAAEYKYPGLHKEDSLSTKLEIKISCSNLPKLDLQAHSNPRVFIFIENKEFSDTDIQSSWSLIDSTEVIKDESFPFFTKKFIIEYFFETIQNLRFMVVNMNDDSDDWEKNDFIGYIDTALADLICSSEHNVYETDLLTSVPPGTKIDNSKAKAHAGMSKILFRIDEVEKISHILSIDITGTNLDKKDTFGKSDPFIIIKREEDNGSMFKVYESPIIKNTLNPSWKDLKIEEKDLNLGDPNRKLLFEVYDWDKGKSNDLIGTFETTTTELFEKKEFEIINEKKKTKEEGYKNSGTLSFKIYKIRTAPYRFMEFPLHGTEIVVSFAIDFTGSNGVQHLPNSLHYNKPDFDINKYYTLNEYERAISAIGSILEPYDSNNFIEVYGYGGKFFNKDTVEFDCALTGDPKKPSVYGVKGVMDVYHKALQTVYLSGPTNFAPIIRKITEEARQNLPPPYENNPLSKYFVLTIITDGVISDMDETKHAIIDATNAPLSIVIVGVGREDFTRMKELDGDDNAFKYKDKVCDRDIVQFLSLLNVIDNPELLAAETLQEIPKQLSEFVQKYKYRPNNS